MRELVRKKNIDPQSSILVESFPDDENFEFGIVVDKNGKVFEFSFDYLGKPIAQGELSEWKNITDWWESTPYREGVSIALTMIETCSDVDPKRP